MPVHLADAPAASRMSTPAMVVEIGKFSCVTSRAQPPFWMRRWALLKRRQNCGIEPTSVGGGLMEVGNSPDRVSLCGPGIVRLPGLSLALIAP